MKKSFPDNRSMAAQFTRHYLFISLIPLVVILIFFIVGAFTCRDYLENMIGRSTTDLNADAERHLQKLGEEIIITKARDVAGQLEIYFRMHPHMDIREMRKDPFFMSLAIQKVGETGYTAVTEAHTWMFRVHPNAELNDTDMRPLEKKIPSWWKIVEVAIKGTEAFGYYDWREPNGSLRKKFLAVTPVKTKLNGITVMASATTYIDEFSTPVLAMRAKADKIADTYQKYILRMLLLFCAVAAVVIILTFYGTYLLGRRAALRYILPITQLAEKAERFGEGHWNIEVEDTILRRQDEIGVMAKSFQGMSIQLRELFGSLEQRFEELKQMQEALRKGEEHFRALYEESQRGRELYRSLISSSADAVVIYDLQGCVTYASPMFTSIFGWREGELIGREIPFLPETEEEGSKAALSEVLEKGRPCRGYETRRLTKDGRLLDIDISASRYNDHEGKPAGMLMILRDISEAKRLKEHLHQVERLEAIATLAGGIAHDFNNLLMVIQGSVSLLLYQTHASDPNYHYFINIEKQVHRGSKLTRQLLGYAREGKYESRPMNINEVVTESAETIRRTRKDIRIRYELARDLHSTEGDVHQIEQVLVNLFINAADAMPNGGELTLETKNISSEDRPPELQPGDYILIVVEDTGIGMDKKTMDRIFEPFFTTKPVDKGTGMGLASAYGIIKKHGGQISVTSEPGNGARFRIYLPASEKTAAGGHRPVKAFIKGKGTILVVDDEKPVLEIAADMLKKVGYTALKSESGFKAIQMYAEQKDGIDLIILDMIMPEMSGSDVFDALRAINPDAMVLLASGYSLDGRATDIMNRGCNGFIQKPYDIETLAEAVKSALKGDEPVGFASAAGGKGGDF